ncbi:MAG: hypothetical protein AAF830_06880 [Pseudomonadota bacterium]
MAKRSLRERFGPTSASSALGTVFRLAIVCGLVGALLIIARIDPVQFWKDAFHWIQTGVTELFGSSVEGIELIITLVATGAVIVLPIWLIGKLLGSRR